MSPQAAPAGMAEASREAPVDYFRLANFLGALAYPARLELLDALRLPRQLGQIRVGAYQSRPGSERPASRQTIRAHLDKLVDADLVRAEPMEPGSRVLRYAINPQKLYALTEEMRRLATLHAGRSPVDATGTLHVREERPPPEGPRLVLVHGMYEGKSFALEPSTARGGQWVIGRKRGLSVSLDYDPYVSLENAAVGRRGAEWVLTDMGSKNGTSLNWARLPKGGSRPLRPADVVGVGRSLLNFSPG